MEAVDFWTLSPELTIRQAVLLVLGSDPAEYSYAESWQDEENLPKGYEALKNAISHALQRGEITGRIIPHFRTDFEDQVRIPIDGSTDPAESMVEVVSLRRWLHNSGIMTGFFFPQSSALPNYMDPRNDRYAPKLAAAVQAW